MKAKIVELKEDERKCFCGEVDEVFECCGPRGLWEA